MAEEGWALCPGPHPPRVRGRPRRAHCPPPQGERPVFNAAASSGRGLVPRAGPPATRILSGRCRGCLAISSSAVPFEVSLKTVLAVRFLTSSLQVAPLKRALSKEGGHAASEQLLRRCPGSQIKEGSWQPECWGELAGGGKLAGRTDAPSTGWGSMGQGRQPRRRPQRTLGVSCWPCPSCLGDVGVKTCHFTSLKVWRSDMTYPVFPDSSACRHCPTHGFLPVGAGVTLSVSPSGP